MTESESDVVCDVPECGEPAHSTIEQPGGGSAFEGTYCEGHVTDLLFAQSAPTLDGGSIGGDGGDA
jgi:hypothetical protein